MASRDKRPKRTALLVFVVAAVAAPAASADTGPDYISSDNVTLVNVREAPIVEGTADGLRLANGDEYPLDIIVCATGWDAATGLGTINLR